METDTHSTSVAAFMVNGSVVIGSDSRRTSRSYGTVHDDDCFKIQHICHKVFGVGSGSTNMIVKVFDETRQECFRKLPTNVNEAADIVSRVAERNIKPGWCSTNFVVGGWITGPCEMYTVMHHKTQTPKRKDRGAKEEYEYKAVIAKEALLGSGKKLMLPFLADKKYKMYPFTASATLEEAKQVIRDAMCSPLNNDYCTDGKLRVVSVSEGGIVGYSCADIIDPGGGEDRYYGQWSEGDFPHYHSGL